MGGEGRALTIIHCVKRPTRERLAIFADCIGVEERYRVGQVVVHLGCFDICMFRVFHYLPLSAWATASLAELAVELGRMMEYNSNSI